ncbi:MAG: ribosomal protein L7/L12 [Myxococcota bacterium]
MNTTNDHLAELREILHREPSQVAFGDLCEALDTWCDNSPDGGLALAYARENLDGRWPVGVRVPSASWTLRALRGDWPPGWALAAGGLNVEMHYIGYRRPEIIRVIRQHSGLGLRAARGLSDGCPGVVVPGVGRDEAEEACTTLRALGASVAMVPWQPEEVAPRFAVWLVGVMGITLAEASEVLYGAGWLRVFRQIHEVVKGLPYLLRDDLCERRALALARELRLRGLQIRVQPSEGLMFCLRLRSLPSRSRMAVQRYLESREVPGDVNHAIKQRLERWRLTHRKAEDMATALGKLGAIVEVEPI